MDQIEEAILKAYRSRKDIDITNFPTITFLDKGTTMIDYDAIMIKRVMIYDKTGFNIENLSLRTLGRRKGSIYVSSSGYNTIHITYSDDTDLELLEECINRDYDEITIDCDNKYIPPIFKNAITTKLILINPYLEYNFLNSIPCYNVEIITEDRELPSFEMLKCTIFTLECSHARELPLMPKEAMKVELSVNNTRPLVFVGNDKIENLWIVAGIEYITLQKFPSLIVLQSASSLIIPEKVLMNLTELKFVYTEDDIPLEVAFNQEGSNVIATIDEYASNFNIPLVRLEIFYGSVQSNIYSLMSGLKELCTGRVLNAEDVPSGLNIFYLEEQHKITDDIVALMNHVIRMKSIHTMTLYLSSRFYNYPIAERSDIYYFICIDIGGRMLYYHDGYNMNIDDVPQLTEALLANRRFLVKDRDLLSYL